MARRIRLCLCGCGQKLQGRKSKRFLDDAHRKWFTRHGRQPRSAQRPGDGPQTGLDPKTVPRDRSDTDVRETNTDVYCSSCHRVRPRWLGPLPARNFCRGALRLASAYARTGPRGTAGCTAAGTDRSEPLSTIRRLMAASDFCSGYTKPRWVLEQ
jgi:hypothetical protein